MKVKVYIMKVWVWLTERVGVAYSWGCIGMFDDGLDPPHPYSQFYACAYNAYYSRTHYSSCVNHWPGDQRCGGITCLGTKGLGTRFNINLVCVRVIGV